MNRGNERMDIAETGIAAFTGPDAVTHRYDSGVHVANKAIHPSTGSVVKRIHHWPAGPSRVPPPASGDVASPLGIEP